LVALQGKAALEGIAKAASEKKQAAVAPKAGQRVHTVKFGIGNFASTGMKVTARLRTDIPVDAKIAAASKTYTVVFSVDLKTNGRPDFEPYLANLLAGFSKIREVQEFALLSTSNLGNGIVRVSVGARAPLPDVDEMLLQMGLNLKPLHNAVDFTLEEGVTVADVFTPEKKLAPVDLANFRIGATVNLDSPLLMQVFTIAQDGGRDAREMSSVLPFLTATDTKVNVQLGDVRELVQTYYDYVVASKGANHYKARDMSVALASLTESLGKEAKREAETDRRGEILAVLAAGKALLYTLQRDLIEVAGATVSLRNGYGVAVGLDGVAVLSHIAVVVEWFAKIAEANVPKPENGGRRRY